MVSALAGVTAPARMSAAKAARMVLRVSLVLCLVEHCEPPDGKARLTRERNMCRRSRADDRVHDLADGRSQAASDTEFARCSSTPIVANKLSRRPRRLSA